MAHTIDQMLAAHRYSVDAAGNRLVPQDDQQALPDNRLTQLNGTRYRYDGAGNLVERQQPNGERLTLGYDGANRLVHLIHASELGATREATYRYDGLGRRISKTVRDTNGTTATTHYGWDGDRIVREETENQRTTVVYEPGSFVPMLRIDDTQQGQVLSAYITDALGTPMQLVTPSGQPRWLAEPDDWAAVKNQRAVRNLTQPIRFQGQWHDEESGFYYNRHRYYDPQQGRYISQDPIGLNGGTNLYGYVTNPISMADPLGLFGANMHHLDPLSIPAGQAYGRSMSPQNQQTGVGEEHIFWRALKDVPRMFGQYVDERSTASAQSMCSALSVLDNNEAMLSVAGGQGLAAELALKASSKGISTIAGIGAGGGAAIVGSVGRSANYGAPENQRGTDWRGFTSISAGTGVWGGDTSLSAGTDGVTGGIRGGYGFGAAVVSGVQAEQYILDCND
tara:strand:- start:2206 stop:3558 length:1353 start_codon:yes stop_codon:yes gene_type:complete